MPGLLGAFLPGLFIVGLFVHPVIGRLLGSLFEEVTPESRTSQIPALRGKAGGIPVLALPPYSV